MNTKHALGLAAALLAVAACAPLVVHGQEDAFGRSPSYDNAFWKHWGDGQAEVSGYDLRFTRYGQERKGTAVAIFVTETFDPQARVKSDSGEGVPVMKLNLVKDFPTGVYDYNTMASSFVALEPCNGMPAGHTSKITFSNQEWCGHVFHQLLFDADGVRESLYSYFQSEGDRVGKLETRPGGISEDALFHWARGFSAPALEPGASRKVPVLMSTQHARLNHHPLSWSEATLSRSKGTQELKVPAGTFTVETLTAKLPERTWTFHVEQAHPRRLIKWSSTGGETGELVAGERMKYWQLNRNGGESALERLGLKKRPLRTP